MDTAEALSAGPPAKGTAADTRGPWVSPSKTVDKAQVGQVSWLEAALLAFPGMSPSGMLSRRSEIGSRTSDSGGAAPDSHRLPFGPPA